MADEPHPSRKSEPFADEALAEFVRALADQPPMSAVGEPGELRRQVGARSAQRPEGPAMLVGDFALGASGVLARLYRPAANLEALAVFLHGGGWTIGDLETHDRACRRLAARSRCSVLAVDYRLAPEHPAPAAVDDAVTALDWVASGPPELGGRPRSVAVVGDSAGGTVAALAALRRCRQRSAPDLVVMVYEAFARRLADDGVLVTLRREPGMVHNFLLWDLVSPGCAAAADRVADDLGVALRRNASAAHG